MEDSKLTSVKVIESLYDSFKIVSVRSESKMSLQKLTNRSNNLYLTDEQYKQKLEKYDNLTISGSNL